MAALYCHQSSHTDEEVLSIANGVGGRKKYLCCDVGCVSLEVTSGFVYGIPSGPHYPPTHMWERGAPSGGIVGNVPRYSMVAVIMAAQRFGFSPKEKSNICTKGCKKAGQYGLTGQRTFENIGATVC